MSCLFAFDTPDFRTYSGLALPAIAEAQVVAFAHEVAFYASPDEFIASQTGESRFASRSFIPAGLVGGLFGASETTPPQATAIFTGHVLEASSKTNSLTGSTFYWSLVDTLGGTYDVVIDPAILPSAPVVGGVLSGTFWLSGRLTSLSQPRRGLSGWLRRLGSGGDR